VRDSLVGKYPGVPEPESILWAGRKVSLGVQAPCEHVGAFRARKYAVLGTRAAANSRAGLRMLATWEVALSGVCEWRVHQRGGRAGGSILLLGGFRYLSLKRLLFFFQPGVGSRWAYERATTAGARAKKSKGHPQYLRGNNVSAPNFFISHFPDFYRPAPVKTQ